MLDCTGCFKRDALGTMVYDTRRKTITTLDVIFALKRMGRTMYGFDEPQMGRDKTKKVRRPVIRDDADL